MRYFNTFLDFVEKLTSRGENVLIHCVSGAHRAGVAAVAWLMHSENLSSFEAISFAKSKRAEIDIIGSFPELLLGLEYGFAITDFQEFRARLDVAEDIKAIRDAVVPLLEDLEEE